jgi:hypothetical protein
MVTMKKIVFFIILLFVIIGCSEESKQKEVEVIYVQEKEQKTDQDTIKIMNSGPIEEFDVKVDRCIYSTRDGGIPYEIGLSRPDRGIPYETYGYKIIVRYHGKTQVGFCELDDIDAIITRLQKKLYWSDNDGDDVIKKYNSKIYTTKDIK